MSPTLEEASRAVARPTIDDTDIPSEKNKLLYSCRLLEKSSLKEGAT
jgi:hypothetical protein